MLSRRFLASAALALVAGSLIGCASSDKAGSEKPKPDTAAPPVAPAKAATAHHDEHPIHNIHRVNDRLISGSGPETPEAFDQLKEMGVKTVISVDGSSPKVELAEARGMRYVHVPVTYATVTDEQRLEIARAIRDLPGPVFVHCHHGKHRGPTALAVAAISLGMMTNEEGTAYITKAGTAPSYAGLYECVADARPASKDALDSASNEFPSVKKAHGTTAAMVEVDLAWEHLGEIKAAGWKTPADSPDLVPAAEAGRLSDNFRICHEDSDYIKAGMGLPADYVAKMAAAMKNASALEEGIVKNASPEKLDAAYKVVQASCKDCHSVYRDKVARRTW